MQCYLCLCIVHCRINVHSSKVMFVILLFCFKGIEIQGLPESFTDELNAEEVWDSVRQEIITSSLTTGKITLPSVF